jgi:hypothetical protein
LAKERERRQQAGRRTEQREQRRVRQHAKRRLRRWMYVAVSAVIGILITVSLFLPSLGGGTNRSAGRNDGPGETFAILDTIHIADSASSNEYNSVPPTSGPHWVAPAPWGIYAEPVPNERQIHNLEHGGIVIQYKSEDTALISQLEDFAKKQISYPCYLMVAPYPAMSTTIAVTAWGVLKTMDAYDGDQLQAFADAYRNRGPEQIPCNPGTP